MPVIVDGVAEDVSAGHVATAVDVVAAAPVSVEVGAFCGTRTGVVLAAVAPPQVVEDPPAAHV
jgi:hypothetical protein